MHKLVNKCDTNPRKAQSNMIYCAFKQHYCSIPLRSIRTPTHTSVPCTTTRTCTTPCTHAYPYIHTHTPTHACAHACAHPYTRAQPRACTQSLSQTHKAWPVELGMARCSADCCSTSAAGVLVGTRRATSARMMASRRSEVSGNSMGCSGIGLEPAGSWGSECGGDGVWRRPPSAIRTTLAQPWPRPRAPPQPWAPPRRQSAPASERRLAEERVEETLGTIKESENSSDGKAQGDEYWQALSGVSTGLSMSLTDSQRAQRADAHARGEWPAYINFV